MKPLSDYTTRELLDEIERRSCRDAADRFRPVRCDVCGEQIDRNVHYCRGIPTAGDEDAPSFI